MVDTTDEQQVETQEKSEVKLTEEIRQNMVRQIRLDDTRNRLNTVIGLLTMVPNTPVIGCKIGGQ